MLLFAVWCLVAACNLSWVASVQVGDTACESGEKLLTKMNEVSYGLKKGTAFIDEDLKKMLPKLAEAIATSPSPALDELNTAFIRYEAVVAQMNQNLMEALGDSAIDFIKSDSRIIDAFSIENQVYFNDDPTKLAAACGVVDTAAKTWKKYIDEVAEIYDDVVKVTVMADADEIKAQIVSLMNDLTTMPNDSLTERARDLAKKIHEASGVIERNIKEVTYTFGLKTNEKAFTAERTLKIASQVVANLLPDPLNWTLLPICDSPDHLKELMLSLNDLLIDAVYVADFFPSKIVGNLKSSLLWQSEQLRPILAELLSNAKLYDKSASEAIGNVTSKIQYVTNHDITSDSSLYSLVDDNQGELDSPTVLNEACKIHEIARDILTSYKFDITELTKVLEKQLTPGVDGLNESLINLASQIKLTDFEDIEKGLKELTQMNDKLQAASKHIQANVVDQLNEFEKSVLEKALVVEQKLKLSVKQLREAFQLPEHDEFEDMDLPPIPE